MLNTFSIGKRLSAAFFITSVISLLVGLSALYFINAVGDAGLYAGRSAPPRVDADAEFDKSFDVFIAAADKLQDTLVRVEHSGDLTLRANIDGQDEVGRTAADTARHLDTLASKLREAVGKFKV